MSLHLMTLFTAHPAKLINLLALLFACPGGWLLHATRRREQRAMASLESAVDIKRVVALFDLHFDFRRRGHHRLGERQQEDQRDAEQSVGEHSDAHFSLGRDGKFL